MKFLLMRKCQCRLDRFMCLVRMLNFFSGDVTSEGSLDSDVSTWCRIFFMLCQISVRDTRAPMPTKIKVCMMTIVDKAGLGKFALDLINKRARESIENRSR